MNSIVKICLSSVCLFCSCCGKEEKTASSHEGQSISLYSGYVAKSEGRLFWFPEKPKYDEYINGWHSENAVEITSCVADPWPWGPGGKECLTKISDQGGN